MKSLNPFRIATICLGLIACLVIVAAGGFDIRLIKKDIRATVDGSCADSAHTEDRHQEGKCSSTHVSALPDAVPGSSATTLLECPPYELVVDSDSDEPQQIARTVTEAFSNYFRILVRSLLRPNAP